MEFMEELKRLGVNVQEGVDDAWHVCRYRQFKSSPNRGF